MKKTILTSLAIMGFAFGAFAQGAVSLDNNAALHGIVTPPSTFYTGTAGIEVWVKSGTSFNVSLINGLAADPGAAYAALTANGFTLATKFVGAAVSGGGFGLGELQMASVSGTVTLAIAAWQGSGNSFGGAANAGVLAFQQPTSNYQAAPPPTAPDLTAATGGFNTTDLILNPQVPEPSSFALAGLGAAAMLIFRRRK